MLIGFLIVIIMVLVIIGYFALGMGGNDETGTISTQVKKIKLLVNNIESEAVMYHGMNNSYNGFNAIYLAKNNIGTELLSTTSSDLVVPMTKNNWENLPDDFNCDGVSEGNDVDFYTSNGGGVFLLKGYIPGNQKAIIVYSCTTSSGDYAQIRFVNQRSNKTYSPAFDKTLENELSEKDTFYGS